MSDQESALLSEKIANFIAKAEFDRQSFLLKAKQFSGQFEFKNNEIEEKLSLIEKDISHFKSIMTRAGAAQWHTTTDKLVKETKADIQLLESIYEKTCQDISIECERLNQNSTNAVKNASQLLSQARRYDLEKHSRKRLMELQNECAQNLSDIQRTIFRFRWKNLALAFVISLVVAMIVSLYINDEWPWQAHEQVIKERHAGEVLISSWKNLSDADKAVILQNA